MKDFIKMTLAVLCGLIILSILSVVITFGAIGSLASSGSSTTLPKQGVLTLDLSQVSVAEQSVELDPVSMIQGGGDMAETIGLRDAVLALQSAAEDPVVQFLFIKGAPTGVSLTGTSHLEELRDAIAKFRESGKAVVSYMDVVMTASYYLASVSDKVYMTSELGGTSMFMGMSGQLMFLGDLLDKLGVNVQLIRHGKYKSAGEMFVRSSSSPENMEQNRAMINSMWKTIGSAMAQSREKSLEDLDALINDLKLNDPEDFLEAGLVDGILTKEELKAKIADLAVAEKYKDVKFISFSDYIKAKVATEVSHSKNKIAVIYADGDIVDGFGKQGVAGDRFANMIAKVRADSTVKAVVLRVNSPGGSVLASEKIKSELDLIKGSKPLIASYGEYAASGGYWISANCDKIYSDASTLTGSIGCFSMIPDFSRTVSNIAHVNITSVPSHKHSDKLSMMRPLDAAETACMQGQVEDIYARFVDIVSTSRSMTPEQVDAIAQGRVWTGAEALEIGLVDEIGTLEDALLCAAQAALPDEIDVNLSDWKIVPYPKPQTTAEMLMSMIGDKGGKEASIFKGTPLEGAATVLSRWAQDCTSSGAGIMLARMPYEFSLR